MNKTKRARLEARGWRVGHAAQFLELSAEEAALVKTKLLLSGSVRERRSKQGLSQSELAKRFNSSQSRVAKIEAGRSQRLRGPAVARPLCPRRDAP